MCPPEGLENTPLRPQSEVTKAHSLGSGGCGSDRGQPPPPPPKKKKKQHLRRKSQNANL